MLDSLWDFIVETLIALAMPMVCSYYFLCGNLFLNVSTYDATGLEKAGNTLLIPFQYLFAAREAIPKADGNWEFVQRFDYKDHFWGRTFSCAIALPVSFILGCTVKGLSYCEKNTRKRHRSLCASQEDTRTSSLLEDYRRIGISIGNPSQASWFTSKGYLRAPGEEKKLEAAKKGLNEIAKVFNEAGILWWVDCGTLLGAYRHGGVIPWDSDIDLSILLPDFENARRALNRLDKEQYLVQDWSGRDFPHTYFKVYVKKTGEMIDIECFEILHKTKELQCIFSLENSIFFPEWFKIRERRFTSPFTYDILFPLKKAVFDGIEIFVPNDSEKYLQRVYGENLAPAKKFNPTTQCYEKDLSHPYWQQAYVH